jgi:hypothetical protein
MSSHAMTGQHGYPLKPERRRSNPRLSRKNCFGPGLNPGSETKCRRVRVSARTSSVCPSRSLSPLTASLRSWVIVHSLTSYTRRCRPAAPENAPALLVRWTRTHRRASLAGALGVSSGRAFLAGTLPCSGGASLYGGARLAARHSTCFTRSGTPETDFQARPCLGDLRGVRGYPILSVLLCLVRVVSLNDPAKTHGVSIWL